MESLIREVILPRLDSLEAELKALRDVSWPVCQAMWETKFPHDEEETTKQKRMYMRHVFKDEGLELLKKKAKFMNHSKPILDHEIRGICSTRLVSSFSAPTLRATETGSDLRGP